MWCNQLSQELRMSSGEEMLVAILPIREGRVTGKRQHLPDRVLGVLVPAGGALLWEMLARLGVIPSNWLPAPSVIAKTIYDLAASGELLGHVAITLWRIVVGFAIGTTAGTLLGGLTGYVPLARKLLDPLL
jgi:sulfonate transport system permease protein